MICFPPHMTHTADFHRLFEKLASAKHVLLATHEHPDADGIGAILAFSLWLERLKKPFTAYVIGTAPSHYSFLPGFGILTSQPPASADMLVAFDYGNLVRLKLETLPFRPSCVATMDHHPRDTQEGDINITDPTFSSSCEMVYHFFRANDVALTKDIATCLYAGIIADTGGFTHSNTSIEVFRIATELKGLGVDTELVAKRILGLVSLGAAHVIGNILSRIAIDKESKVMYSSVSFGELEAYHTDWNEIEICVNLMNHIQAPEKSVKCVALFKDKNDGMISVSLRSDPHKGFDARALAHTLGGGGHRYAAAAKIKGTLAEVIAKVLAEAKNTAR